MGPFSLPTFTVYAIDCLTLKEFTKSRIMSAATKVYKYYIHIHIHGEKNNVEFLVSMDDFFSFLLVCVCVCFKREKAKKCTVIRKWQTAEGRVSQLIREDKPQNANPTQLHPSTLANQYKGAEEKWEGQ